MNRSKLPDLQRILVTGGAGFIGSHITDRLALEGYEIVILDDLSTGMISNIKTHLKSSSVRFIQGDVRDPSIAKKSLEGCDAVIHLAGMTSVERSIKEPSVVNDVNVNGTLNLLKTSLHSGIKIFVYASSAAVYGDNPSPLREDMLPKPISPYGVSRLAAEYYCLSFWKMFGLPAVILRYFNVYGRRMSNNGYAPVIQSFIKDSRNKERITIYGDGKQTRDFVHVDDVVQSLLLALRTKERFGEIFNIGTGIPMSINQLAQLVINLTSVKVDVKRKEAREGEIKHSHADISKARQKLGFQPKVDLKKGLQDILLETYVQSMHGL